jgi:hypothetical protein
MTIIFDSDYPQQVQVSAPADESGRGRVYTHVADTGRSRLKVSTTTGVVWVSTKDSIKSGYYTQLGDDADGIGPNRPYTQTDLQDAAIGGALGIIIALAYQAVKRLTGVTDKPEVLS